MSATYTIVLELYVCLTIVNVFLGLTQTAYEEGNPGESIRSPFNQYPLGSDLITQRDQVISDTTDLTANFTDPTNSTGFTIPWVSDAISDFTAIIDVILDFVSFFTGAFIAELLISMGLPSGFLYIITVPMGIYVMYMVFVLITNRLGN